MHFGVDGNTKGINKKYIQPVFQFRIREMPVEERGWINNHRRSVLLRDRAYVLGILVVFSLGLY